MRRTAANILKQKEPHIVSVAADATIREALTLMTQNRVGAILIKGQNDEAGNDTYVGIWTERDLMYQLLQEGFDINTARIGDFMTTELVTAHADEQVYQLYDKFLGRRIRHLLVEEEGRFIGLLSVGDVVKGSLQQKVEEYRELNEMVSLEYYENWKAIQAEKSHL